MLRPLLLIISLLTPAVAFTDGPIVRYQYSPVFDNWCTSTNGTAVSESARQQLLTKIDNLQAEWDALGPSLLATTEKLIGKPFLRREVTATLFLCGRTPSMSVPLLINGNWFVEGEAQLSDEMATHIVFHELLHVYIVDHFLDGLSLRKKYEDLGEHFLVLNHLHLMAIQKHIYLELGLERELEMVIESDSNLPRGAYKRSWEIVDDVGHEIFVADLQ